MFVQNGLVSLIVPSFNVEPYIGEFIDSVCAQTYKNTELIFVNDGSTDKTRAVIQSRMTNLKAECRRVTIVDQKNRGLAAAINSGLRLFSGEFLMWPDPDDWLERDSIEKRVSFLRDYPRAGLLRSNSRKYLQETKNFGECLMPPRPGVYLRENAFEDIINRRTFTGGLNATVRSRLFLKAIPSRQIYEDRAASQNFQMLLPIASRFPVIETAEVLGFYRVRNDSRSHSAVELSRKLSREKMVEKVLLETVRSLGAIGEHLVEPIKLHYRHCVLFKLQVDLGMKAEALKSLETSEVNFMRRMLLHAIIPLVHDVRRDPGSKFQKLLRRAVYRLTGCCRQSDFRLAHQ